MDKCNCGRENRYFHGSPENDKMSCNKFYICPTYSELEALAAQLNKEKFEILTAAEDLKTYREGTSMYKEAESTIDKFLEEYEKALNKA